MQNGSSTTHLLDIFNSMNLSSKLKMNRSYYFKKLSKLESQIVVIEF